MLDTEIIINHPELLEQLKAKPRKDETVGSILLNNLKDKTVRTVCDLAAISEAAWYKIISGGSEPKQDTLLRLAFVLEMTPADTQALLKSGHCPRFTMSRERDLMLIEGLYQKCGLGEMDERLKNAGFPGLIAEGKK